MKELVFRISLYDLEEVSSNDIVNIHEYFDGYFPNNKSISHTLMEVPNMKDIFIFAQNWYRDIMNKEDEE